MLVKGNIVAATLRELLNSGKAVLAPGAYDGLSAELVEDAGFSLVYASGGAMARASGYPDINLLSQTEVVDRLEKMADVIAIPIIADADTGFGGSANVHRTVRLFQRIGIAGLHIEDQVFPKKCGRMSGKGLVSAEEMCLRLRIAVHARGDNDLVLIARTDANTEEGFESALSRVQAYERTGVDMVFVEGLSSVEQIERLGAGVKIPKLINMYYGGKAPLLPMERLAELGFLVVIAPSDLQRAAIGAMQRTLAALKADGHSQAVSHEHAGLAEREAISRTARYSALDAL